jgi:ABC-type enterochelin transport system permease subunit
MENLVRNVLRLIWLVICAISIAGFVNVPVIFLGLLVSGVVLGWHAIPSDAWTQNEATIEIFVMGTIFGGSLVLLWPRIFKHDETLS